MSPERSSIVSSRNVWSPAAPSRIPHGPSSLTLPSRLSSGGGWPAAATVSFAPSINPQTSVTGASRVCSTRISLTSPRIAAGLGSSGLVVRTEWRTSEVNAAASIPLPVTSPRKTARLTQQTLDQHRVHPLAVEPAVAALDANLGEARRLVQRQTRVVGGETRLVSLW